MSSEIQHKEDLLPERILCSAVRIVDNKKYPNQPIGIETGFVIAGYRHSDCFETLNILAHADVVSKFISNFSNLTVKEKTETMGFLTSKNRYVTRAEAYQIAKAQNQIAIGRSDLAQDILISENLY